ncbi:MAG: hypothetical protein CBB60_000040 [Armatimonadetes bacterium Cent15-Ar3]|jgi:hypothetical protein|nr:MAG: hypothetical protein CBB60_000040 [Armatimonadetes bacterium Cent15-Ar3]
MRTTEQKEKSKQYVLGCTILFGISLAICSGGLGYMFSVSSVYRATYTREPVTDKITDMGTGSLVPLTLTGIFLGVCIAIGGLVYGYLQEKNKNQGARLVLPSSRIIARFAIDKNGLLITDETSFEFQEKLRFYVRVLSPTEGSLEYECAEPLFYQCGEGMIGDVEITGRWIGAFRPYLGMEQTHVGEKF